jgi:hypothetical protein
VGPLVFCSWRLPECESCDRAGDGWGRSGGGGSGPELRREEEAGDGAAEEETSNIRSSSPDRDTSPPVYGGVTTDPDDSFRSRFLSGARPDTYMPLPIWCIDLPCSDVTQPGAKAIELAQEVEAARRRRRRRRLPRCCGCFSSQGGVVIDRLITNTMHPDALHRAPSVYSIICVLLRGRQLIRDRHEQTVRIRIRQ